MSVLSLDHLYYLLGGYFFITALHSWRSSQHLSRTAFWCVLAVLMVTADYLPPALIGAMVILLTVLARDLPAPKGTGNNDHDNGGASDQNSGINESDTPQIAISLKKLLVPILILPLVTVLTIGAAKYWPAAMTKWLDARQFSLSALALGALIGLIAAMFTTRLRVQECLKVSGRFLQGVGWVVLMPALLASLGAVLAKVHLGDTLSQVLLLYFPVHSAASALLVLAVSMLMLTMLLGNAFAAFPVVMAAIGIPILIGQYHANVAALAALTMLTGYCGTLLTPMAANFNLLPVTLLGLPDRYAVIRAQLPTALAMLACNVTLLYWLVLP